MTRSAIIFHGTGANPDVAWLPWLRQYGCDDTQGRVLLDSLIG